MNTVQSKDGTKIAFERAGTGSVVVLVDGALCHRGFGPMRSVAKLLAPHFTVFTFDRRGRGESTDTPPYSVEREVEDIAALIQEAGGSANVFGTSSGAALAIEAAVRLNSIKKVAMYEAPFFFDEAHPPRPDDYLSKMTALITADRRAEALKLFMKTVGTPAIFINLMRFTPVWPKLKRVAHTLPYDLRICSDTRAGKPLSRERWASVTMPVLTAVGGKSPVWWQKAMKELADVLPNAQHVTLPGQTHMVKASVLAPALVQFFANSTVSSTNKLAALTRRNYMQSTTESASVSKGARWTGIILSAVAVLFMLFDGFTKVMKAHQVIEATVRIGFPENTIVAIGATLLVCTALYVIPRTSMLGAILLTAYLGGATAANVRAGSPAFNTSFPVIFGILVWLGLFLRESRLRALIPLRT